MKYSKIQKLISYILLFAFFLNISINIPPIFSLVLAKESAFYNLVSIIVDEKTYAEIKSELERYSVDISNNVENTKVVIVPIPENASPFVIASMNESMYFDGYKSLANVDFESKLSTSIFVGNIPLPTVYKGEDFTRTALPYVDFEEKSFIFDREKNRYEENSGNYEVKPEIEFSFISPNTGSFSENIKDLKNFFDKNHDYYTGNGIYKKLNGTKQELDHLNYRPYVFYYDYIREVQGFNPNLYSAYLATRQKNEDLSYNRYTKDLLKYLSDATQGESTKEILSLAKGLGGPSQAPESTSYENIYDIQTRLPIERLKKNFIDSFSKGNLGELRKDVFDSGRYNFGQSVNVDFLPYIVSEMDIFADEILRSANDKFEAEAFEGAKKLSRKIAVPSGYIYYNPNTGATKEFKNFLFGNNAGEISSAESCSFYRGSKQLVESNRGLNILNSEKDMQTLDSMGCSSGADGSGLEIWGRNSPLYLDSGSSPDLKLKPGTDNKGAIVELFDIIGSKISSGGASVNAKQCFDNNYLLTKHIDAFENRNGVFSLKTIYEMRGQAWSCRTDNNAGDKTFAFKYNFIEDNITDFKDSRNPTTCDIKVNLDGKLIRKLKNPDFIERRVKRDDDTYDIIKNCEATFDYKSINSLVRHSEPLVDTINKQAENMVSPNLPIDEDRYADFITKDGKYAKRNFFDYFDVKVSQDDDLDQVREKIKSALDAFPHLVISEDFQSLNTEATSGIASTMLKVDSEGKADIKINELPGIEFAVLWNNLSTSRKYSLIYEKYLSNDFEWKKDKPDYSQLSNIFKKTVLDQKPKSENLNFLPKLKEDYEISYLGAYGNAQNMMIKFDPKIKEENPYADIIAKNEDLSSKIFGNKVVSNFSGNSYISSGNGQSGGLNGNSGNGSSGSGQTGININHIASSSPNSEESGTSSSQNKNAGGLFKCAPPDGVPIWKWMSAIQCRLKDMLPPKIKISDGHCSVKSVLGYTKYGKQTENPFSISANTGNLQNTSGNSNSGQNQNSSKIPNSCSLDNDKNGISDCLESVNSLKISSDSSSYSYNSNISLQASFYQNDSKATFVNNSSVVFEIVKLEKAKDENEELNEKNIEIIFDRDNPNLNNEENVKNILKISSSSPIRSNLGEVKFLLSTTNKDLNIYLRAKSTTEGNTENDKKVLVSDILKLEVRSNSLTTLNTKFIKSSKKFETSFSTIKSSDKANIYLFDLQNKNFEDFRQEIEKNILSEENLIIGLVKNSKKKDISIKYPIKVKLFENDNVIQELDIQNRQEFIKMSPLSNSGTYTLQITDSDGFSTKRKIYVTAQDLSKIDIKLGSNILLAGGSISTNLFTVYDKYDNPVSGKRFETELSFDNKNFSFIDSVNGETNKIYSDIYEGFQIFRIKSSENSGESNLTIKLIDPDTKKVLLTKTEKIKSILNADIKLSNANFSVGGEKSKFKISLVDEKGNLISSINSRVYFGGSSDYFEVTKDYFDLKNGEAEIEIETRQLAGNNIPVEIQVEGINKIFSKSINIGAGLPVKLEVIVGDSKIEADTDKFSTVYLELRDKYNNTVFGDSTTKAKVVIEKGYEQIISGGGDVQFKNGVASLKINATKVPGTGYFKVITEPPLEKNSFQITDDSGSLTVSGVSENIGKIETFYFWNKEKIEKQNYNSLYSVLLGGNYGDIEQKDYLAGSLIFERDSRALAVTTLIDTGDRKNNILSINNGGNLKNIFGSGDISQMIKTNFGIENGKIFFNVYNTSLNINIGQVFYNLKNIKTGVCDSKISDCFDKKESSVYGQSKNEEYKFYSKNDKIVFVDNSGNEYFSIDSSGNIDKKSAIRFELNDKNALDYLSLNIFVNNEIVGELGINLINSEINISRDSDVFKNKKQSSNNSILVNFTSNFYGSYKTGKNIVVFYNDPFSSSSSLNNFARSSLAGFENFKNTAGLGWKDENKTLLSFVSGKTVGASVKDFMSFYTINIGDPFVKLKTQKKTFNGTDDFKQFDSTIGEIISNDEDVIDYKVFDYNGDGRKDILLRKMDNYLELLENKNNKQKFLSLGNISQIYDLGQFLDVGDFTGDKFEDIFFISNDGKPYLLNNIFKDFSRVDLSNKLGINSRITSASVSDMDNDGKSDLIILDETGELNIFYGGGVSANPTFTKKKISDGLGLKLSSDSRKFGGAIYYDGLYQPTSLGTGIANVLDTKNKTSNSFVDSRVVDSEIYVNFPYNKTKKDIVDIGDNTVEQTYFLKSDYFSSVGLEYEKSFKDRNGGVLASGDIVDVEIKVTNNSGRKLSKIKFLEKFEDYFEIDFKTVTNSKNLKNISGIGYYNLSFEEFDLNPGENFIIKYSGKSRTLTHLKIRTGLFEKGEVGDDKVRDILIDDVNTNCFSSIGVFKSTGNRDYQRGQSDGKCDMSKLPDSISKLSKDDNKNGTPDYIENLQDPNNMEERQKYAKEQLGNLNKDSDNDGTPDDYDSYDNSASSAEKALDMAENILDGLSCGFNNGACIASPLNWAPLAPGSDPTFMGMPIGDGLWVEEGLPIFSSLTGKWYGKVCGPSVWPISPMGLEGCSIPSAGGYLGTWSPSNVFRIFVTPTLTGGIGTAICFGGPASVVGYSNPPGLAPIFPGGNCIVLAKPLLKCSPDGSEGDPSTVGTPDNFSDFSTINAGNGNGSGNGSCKIGNSSTGLNINYIKTYLNSSGGKNDKNVLGVSNFKGAVQDNSRFDGKPPFNIDMGGGSGLSIELVPKGSSSSSDFSDITKIAEERIQSFPEFLMDWVVRQIDEIVSKLTDFPTIKIIFPDFTGLYDSDKSWQDNWKEYKNSQQNSTNDTININSSSGQQKLTQVNSGIREAYEFIATLPLVNINQEVVNINVPWISGVEIDRAVISLKESLAQRKEEATKYVDKENYKGKISVDVNGLIGSIEKNIEILESYRDIPEKIKELIGKKEDYLYQILCNVEIISDLIGGRIGENGKRFKAWVELYILIKAILKSWQTFIDIFVNYEQECKECKNERHDLINYQFKLVSMIVPQIPVVRFPKWPDIIIDLHNVRAGLDIAIPEFHITTKPIIIPHLPPLSLPNIPNVNGTLNLPDIPTLPEFEIPELPDIPTLPKIELPDLPPPLKLPKLFEGFEFIIDIAKLVTKAMCILKKSPFHPEWRAGDQISFLTERNGYLGIDFIKKSLPQFSIPFVDAIEVKTFVSLEFETDFIVELAEQIAQPINSFTSDFTNMFNVKIDEIDIGSNKVPSDINIDATLQTSLDRDFHMKLAFGKAITNHILKGVDYAEKHKDETVTSEEFKKYVAKFLSNPKIAGNPLFDDLRETWKIANEYSYNKEDEFINSLQKYNFEKFETLKNIIETERQKNRNFEREIDDIFSGKIKVSDKDFSSSVPKYNEEMEKFNEKTFENIGKVYSYDENKSEIGEIKTLGEDLKQRSNKVFTSYAEPYKTDSTLLESYEKVSNLLANNNGAALMQDSCSSSGHTNSNYSYKYSGIYVMEKGKSYRLFDYIGELKGDEVTTPIDFDVDGDEDLLYFVNNTLFLKENHKNKNTKKIFLGEKPYTLPISSNKFLQTNFIESVNDAFESSISSSMINIEFKGLKGIYNYRLNYFDIVDKYLNPDRIEQNNLKNKYLVDGISSSDEVTKVEENSLFVKRKDLVYINRIGNFKGIEMKTTKLESIKNDLNSGNSVTVSSGNIIYSGGSPLDFNYISSDGKTSRIRIEANSSIELKEEIVIVSINTGNGFIDTREEIIYSGDEISKMKGLPISFETKIYFKGDKTELREDSYIDLKYYDNSEVRLDFNKIYSWELYDLGYESDEYLFSINSENNYYYSRINAFKNNILGTSTKQILLSPQLKADKNLPEISLNSVKVPVYQEMEIDITDKISEDSGIKGISKIFIDFFLEVDSNGDLNPKNDDNSHPNLRIYKKENKIFLKVGKFTTLQKKKIGINIVDENGNLGFKEIDFEVYSPIPEIETYDGNTISGKISENLKDEPINFYRFRAGSLSKLGDEKNITTIYTNEKGEFSLNSGKFVGGLLIKDSTGKEVASISEKTGRISINSINKQKYNIRVKTETNTNLPEISIFDDSSKLIFKQVLNIKGNPKVTLVSGFENLEKNGVYVKMYENPGISNYILPENISNNPGVLVGFRSSDTNQTPIFKIYPDSRLDLPENYNISYSEYGDYVVLKISDNAKKQLFDILLKMDADYVIN